MSQTPGKVRLEHCTPDRTYDLGAFTVTDGAPRAAARSFGTLRTDPGSLHRRASGDRPRHRTAAGQGARVLLADATALRARRHAGIRR